MLTVYYSKIPASTSRFPLRLRFSAHACAPGTCIHIQTTHLCSEDPRGSSHGEKGDHGRDGSLSPAAYGQDLGHASSTTNVYVPSPRPLSSRVRHAAPCRRTREHNYTTRRHPCTNTMHPSLLILHISPLPRLAAPSAFGRARVPPSSGNS